METDKEHIYFVGIGGIGMSALARYFNQKGKKVAGYDRTITTLTKQLQAEGIAVTNFDEADSIPFPYRDKEKTLVVYTPAIPPSNSILTYFKEEKFLCLKRAAVLGLISKNLKTIAVGGTHGKTTVSSMIAFLLKDAGIKVNAFLGGISRDFGTNLILDDQAEYMVTEADEYDRSFLQLAPFVSVITAIDADHLDIYADEDDIVATYKDFANKTDLKGVLYSKETIFEKFGALNEFQKRTYGLSQNAWVNAKNLKVKNGEIHFDLIHDGNKYKDFTCGLPGKHNVENATAAIAVALELGVEVNQIKASLAKFKGVKRRFDVHLKTNDFIYIDDYAHHPQEIKALISSVRELYPEKQITAIFQPHLYSRTQDFGDEFGEELAKIDDLILLELYPAREEPIEGIDSRWLAKKINKENVHVCSKGLLMNVLKSKKIELLLTIGAGDIDTMVEPIIAYYE